MFVIKHLRQYGKIMGGAVIILVLSVGKFQPRYSVSTLEKFRALPKEQQMKTTTTHSILSQVNFPRRRPRQHIECLQERVGRWFQRGRAVLTQGTGRDTHATSGKWLHSAPGYLQN